MLTKNVRLWLIQQLFLTSLYWPLHADFSQFSDIGGAVFILSIALVMIGTLFFVINIFKTIAYSPEGHEQVNGRAMLALATGFSWKESIFGKKSKRREHLVSLPVAAIARGTVDTALNAAIITFTGVLILVYMMAHIMGYDLKDTVIDTLLYKNWYWWGLKLIADGLLRFQHLVLSCQTKLCSGSFWKKCKRAEKFILFSKS